MIIDAVVRLTKCVFNNICYLHKTYLQGSDPSSDVSSVPLIAKVILSRALDLPLISWKLVTVLRFKDFLLFPRDMLKSLGLKWNSQANALSTINLLAPPFLPYLERSCNYSHKKRKDILEGSPDRVLFAAELDFPKMLVLRLPITENQNNCLLYETSFLEHWYFFMVNNFSVD